MLALATACSRAVRPAAPPVPAATPADVESTLFLIGDAGAPSEDEPVLAALEQMVRATPEPKYLVYLGDNIYPRGLPDSGAIGREEAAIRANPRESGDPVLMGDQMYADYPEKLSLFDEKFFRTIAPPGRASILECSREEIRALYQPDWKVWFGKLDEVRDGGPDDPRLALILVDADSVTYMKRDKPRPMVLFEVAKSMVTGGRPELGTVKKLQLNET